VRVSEANQVLGANDKWEVGGGSFPAGASSADAVGVFLTSYGRDNEDHTAGMAADASGVFHPFWVDNRTGTKQVWTAPITISVPVVVNGSLELAKLEDLSKKVVLELRKFSFNRKTSVISVDARLKNVSKEVLEVPMKVRVISLESASAKQVTISNSDNKQGSLGAVWDFSSQLKDNVLQPGETSEARVLTFHLSGLLGKRDMLVNMRVRVLGRSRASNQAGKLDGSK